MSPGDRVALVSPAGPAPASLVAAGVEVLRSWGLVVDPPDLSRGSLPYLADSDAHRAAEFVAAWRDPDVRAVICTRGGYGCLRMADLVDWESLPDKVFVGSSDVTTLHTELLALGRTSVFGPMPGTHGFVSDPVAQQRLRAQLFAPPHEFVGGTPLVPGVARGVLVGGTVSLLAASLGGPRVRLPTGAIALLEDVDEEPYRLDRLLTQLRRAGWFDGVTGIVLGSWSGCGDVAGVLADRLGDLGVPVLADFGFGHCAGQLSLPLGVRAELDVAARTLTVCG